MALPYSPDMPDSAYNPLVNPSSSLTMPDVPSMSGAIGAGPANTGTENPSTGNGSQNLPQKPGAEDLVDALLVHLAETASMPTPRYKTDYEKPPFYNIVKLKKGVSKVVL